MEKDKDLLTFLEEAGGGLSVYHSALRNELKIEAAQELWNVHDQDLEDIRMRQEDIHKLRKHLRKEYPHSALGKLKKKVVKSSSDAPVAIRLAKVSGDRALSTPIISPPRPIGKRIIPQAQVVILSTIGHGEFGKVQKGVWTDEAGQKHDVALKTLNKDKMELGLQEFLKEAGSMQSVHHTCIVEFFGIVFDDQNSLMLVSEFAPMRSLLECLQQPMSSTPSFSVAALCRLAEQVADGMSYLEAQRLIHRDLAARNILVFAADKVKISDFGLSLALGLNKDYYETKYDVNLKLPIAWCPPESINQLQFSSASDVWSFGVTLWEMFSYGQKPWGTMAAREILAAIDEPSKKRLEKPSCCPRDYYALMRRCWEHTPSLRPKFATIVTELPRLRPVIVRAVHNGSSTKARGMLQYSVREEITVLDDRPAGAPSTTFWLGVTGRDNRRPGFFDATEVEPVRQEDNGNGSNADLRTRSLPRDSSSPPSNPLRGLSKLSPSKASQRKKITSAMIGKPESDLRHTGHIGYDGVMFGDVSFIGSNYDKLLPVKAAKVNGAYDSADSNAFSLSAASPAEELSDFQFPDLSLSESIELSTSFIDEMMKDLRTDRWSVPVDAGQPASMATVTSSASAVGGSGDGIGQAPCDAVSSRNGHGGVEVSHYAISVAAASRPPACVGGGGESERHGTASNAADGSGGSASGSRHRKSGKIKLTLPGNRERRDSGSSTPGSAGGGGAGLKAMSAADERMIDEVIELANHFASSSLQSAHTPREVDVEPDTPSKSKSRFSFKFPSKKTSPVAEKKTFTDDLVLKSTAADQALTPEAEEAYNLLVAKGSAAAKSGRGDDDGKQGMRPSLAHRVRPDEEQEPHVVAEVDGNPFRKLREGPVLLTRANPKQQSGGAGRGGVGSFRSTNLSGGEQDGASQVHTIRGPAPPPPTRRSAAGSTDSRANGTRRPPPLDLARRQIADQTDDLSDMPASPPPPVPMPKSLMEDDEGIGIYDNLDPFWRQEMRIDFEADEEITGMQGRYKSRSDTVSYEDLLEFSGSSSGDPDTNVRVLLKVLGKEVTEAECVSALKETKGDVFNAVKYLKLRQLRALGLGDVAQCKEALLSCKWDVQRAADYVLDRRRRVNSDIVDV